MASILIALGCGQSDKPGSQAALDLSGCENAIKDQAKCWVDYFKNESDCAAYSDVKTYFKKNKTALDQQVKNTFKEDKDRDFNQEMWFFYKNENIRLLFNHFLNHCKESISPSECPNDPSDDIYFKVQASYYRIFTKAHEKMHVYCGMELKP